ncbi:MAG TPA: GNAT family N-acetyltransferase [Candidatus Kapabacteria bacterium]
MVRSISIGELDRFISEPEEPENLERVRTFFIKQLESGETRPEWCFVLDNGANFLARIIVFTFPRAHPEYGITFFAFDRELSFGSRASFIKEVALRMHEKVGASIFTHEQRTSSEKYNANIALLQGAGFSLCSSRLRYTLDVSSFEPLIKLPAELIEHSIADVGTEEFIKALPVIISNSLDSEDILRIKEYGAVNAARHFYQMLSSRDTSLEQWKIYFTSTGDLIGVVIPQFFGDSKDTGTIGYIGINPTMRSKGYGRLILKRALSIMAQEGALKMVDECDSANASAAHILEQIGYKRQYEKEIRKLVIG